MINGKTIFLVVDDFECMRTVTSTQLRAMGAKSILMASNGAEALHMLQSRRVDIVLSDWNMPVMTGLELLKAVRADKNLSYIPFIMITAEADRLRVIDAIASGVSELLVKPYTSDSLSTRINKVLTSKPRSNPPVLKAQATRSESPSTHAVVKTIVPRSLKSMRQTILIVDDTEDNLLLLSQLFKDEYRVRIAQTGEKALEICQSDDPPDLVLLDIMMPSMDGFEVARRMREHPTSETIPVIFVTAMSGVDVCRKCLELGAVDFVAKPIDPYELKPRVRNFMRYVALHKQLQADFDNMLELAHMHESIEQISRHDMKGSLAGVIGLVQMLADDDSMSHKQVAQLRMAEETALLVLDMINLSSELFKIETGCFELNAEKIKIDYILRRIVEISRTAFAEKHLIVIIDTDISVGEEMPDALGDAMLCYSLFQNLIKNACEAAPEEGRVVVNLKNEDPLRIIIQNKGAVPAEIRERFFDKYVTCGKHGGTGIGTYSAKLLVEAQNGTILLTVSDKENLTTIAVTLPRYAEVAA